MPSDPPPRGAATAEVPELWSAAAAAAATRGVLAGGGQWRATGVEIDSRLVRPGDLFVALTGGARDGHDFVAAALERGAAAALVSADPSGVAGDAPLLRVSDTLVGLECLGAAARERAASLRAVAVTGSVGKTSTKEMLAALLAPSGHTHAAAKSFNNHIGVPLTLARTPRDAAFGVYEIGMNAPGEIAPLSRRVRPHVAIVTAVEAVHLAAFAGLDGVADEKISILEGLTDGGVAILNADASTFERQRAQAEALGVSELRTFGVAGDAARLEAAIVEDGARTRVAAEILGRSVTFEIGAPGRHWALNALAALLAVDAAGGDVPAAVAALGDWRAVAGRGRRERLAAPGGGVFWLLDESYNANPASLRAALAVLAATPAPRRVAFVTDMLELGPTAAALHAEIAAAPGVEAVSAVHTAGPLAKALHVALPAARRGVHAVDAAALAAQAMSLVRDGDVVMVKGSNGSQAGAVAAALRALGPA